MGAADVDDDIIGGQRLAEKRHVDDEGRAVQTLRGPEQLPAKTMRDHDVVANLDGVHAGASFQELFDGRDRTKGRRGAIGPSESARPPPASRAALLSPNLPVISL